MNNFGISISPKRLFRFLIAIAIFLVILSTASALADFYNGHHSKALDKLCKLFYVELENNAPSFFSMLILLLASLLLLMIACLKAKSPNAHVREWGILSAGFFYMAFDEVSALHEKLIFPVRDMLGENKFGVFYFAWVLPAMAIVLFLGIYFLKFLRSLAPNVRFYFLLSAAIFLGGAIGMEMLDGDYTELHGKDNLGYIALTTIEETMEMAGIILFNWALAKYLADSYKEVRIYFTDDNVSPTRSLSNPLPKA